MKTDPTHESPDLIDARAPSDPTRLDPKPGDPSVTPGISLPSALPAGWTLAPDGSVLPPPEPVATPPVMIPELVITAAPPASALSPVALFAIVVLTVGAAFALRRFA